MAKPLGSKLYYSIGEVAELTELAPYTLRAWENEFACLRPKRVHGKNRAYRSRDIAIVLLIQHLLHAERYSTAGAQQKLRNEPELVRGAVEHLSRLHAGEATLEELAAAGGAESPARPAAPAPAAEAPASEARASEAPPGQAPAPAIHDADRALLREVRSELRAILQLLR